MEEQPAVPPAPALQYCYRHPSVPTGVHCSRCGRPICPECMIQAPVGHQCPDCVAEARAAFRKSGAGVVHRPSGAPVTMTLIAMLVVGFVVQTAVSGTVARGADVPFAVAQGEYWRLITSIFLHGGLLHLALNCYALWIFGPFIENAFGRVRFLLFFFVTGFLASATSYALAPVAALGVPSIGASGAIFGLFGVFLAYNYRRRNFQYNRALLRQAYVIIALNVAINVFGSSFLDWRAHVGGLMAGVAAGYALETLDPDRSKPGLQALVFVGLVALGVAAVAWKTAAITALLTTIA